MTKNQMIANWLLLVGGAAHAIPMVNSWISGLFNGYVQIGIGVVSVILAIMLLMKK